MKAQSRLPCPVCGRLSARVTDTRGVDDLVRRRRECSEGHRWTTVELALPLEEYGPHKTVLEALRDELLRQADTDMLLDELHRRNA